MGRAGAALEPEPDPAEAEDLLGDGRRRRRAHREDVVRRVRVERIRQHQVHTLKIPSKSGWITEWQFRGVAAI